MFLKGSAILKKLVASLLVAMLLLSACSVSQPKPTEAKLVATHTDEAFLTDIWEKYLDDTTFTIANGRGAFDSVEDISLQALISYLFLQMQRDGLNPDEFLL